MEPIFFYFKTFDMKKCIFSRFVFKIEGLVAAAFTPLHADGSLNREMIPEVVDKLVEDGLKGIFVCGSNGEGPNMTSKERNDHTYP